jgi:hypothetical protein|tara:strand:- start:1274 stop:1462 length:189 start_codon:yes stop_codon:yes gene_type:complete
MERSNKKMKIDIKTNWTEVLYISCLILENKNSDSKAKEIAFNKVMESGKLLDSLINTKKGEK